MRPTEQRWRCGKCKRYIPDDQVKPHHLKALIESCDTGEHQAMRKREGLPPRKPRTEPIDHEHRMGGGWVCGSQGVYGSARKQPDYWCGPVTQVDAGAQEQWVEWLEATP